MKLKMYLLLTLLSLGIGCSNAQEGSTKLSKKVNEYLTAYEEAGFSGAILIAENGKITLNKGFGYANDSAWTSVSPSTVWTIGSITKPLTATAILKLESLGRLSVKDRIASHIPGLREDIGNITIHQLLTHTSGLAEYSGYDAEKLDGAGFVDFINKTKLRYTPGEKFEYSNVGYSTLGIIIERVSGQPYEQFLNESILTPAGINNTGYVLPRWDKSKFAVGYNSRGSWGTVYDKNDYENGVSWNLKANGGILSTPEDMYKLHLALKGNVILPKEYVEKMYGQYIRTPGDFSPFNDKSPGYYGYGWGMTESANFKPIIMHGGSNDVFEAGFMYYPEDDIFFFIASNRTIKNAVPAILDIDKIISKKKYTLPKPDVVPDSELTKSYEGEYVFEDGSRFTIARDEPPTIVEGSLVIRPKDKLAYDKIVGDKINSTTAQEIVDFTADVLEKSRKKQPFGINMAESKKVQEKDERDEEEDTTVGVDDRPINVQLEEFWKKSLDEKGQFVRQEAWGAVGVGDRYWALVKIEFEGGITFMNLSIGQDDGEIKRFSTSHRPVGLILRPKSNSQFHEVNSGGQYQFSLNKGSGNVKAKCKLKGDNYTASK